MKQQENQPPGIRWTAISKNVDIETGEIITETIRKREYIIIKTKKNGKINNNGSAGIIEYTRECRRNPQKKLFAD